MQQDDRFSGDTSGKAVPVDKRFRLPSRSDMSYTQNRELSWLSFNQRCLNEANNQAVPPLERMRFISIFTTNLDEFFMVRVGSLFDLSLIEPDKRDNKTDMTPSEQLGVIFEAVRPVIDRRDTLYERVSGLLAKSGIEDVADTESLDKDELHFAKQYFRDYIRPVLSPQVVDERHPFPHLENKRICIACLLADDEGGQSIGIVPMPDSVPPIIEGLGANPTRFIRTEELIQSRIGKIFKIYTVSSVIQMCVTRNADISYDEEKFDDEEGNYRDYMAKLLRKRRRLAPVRLEYRGDADSGLIDELCRYLKIGSEQVYKYKAPLSASWAYRIESHMSDKQRQDLLYPPFMARYPENLDQSKTMIEQIEQRDILLFYPYDAMTPFLQLLKEAADNPQVQAIKITIYRLAENSQVGQRLCEAAEAGKDVTVLMELRARFDEAHNILWAKRLEESGCHIIYGPEDYKCHSKVCLIVYKSGEQTRAITQIGTGNYNEKTARLYTDLCLMTSDEAIGQDAIAFFENMLINDLDGKYERLLVSPTTMKSGLFERIDRQIALRSEGRILIKCNGVTERDLIDKLACASQAGVRVCLLVRGICCMLPGVEGKTDNVEVVSIVGRFLEHSRVYIFGTGEDREVFISSADLMTRNILNRVEVACPVTDQNTRSKVIQMMDVLLSDTVQMRRLKPNGSYKRVRAKSGEEPLNAQGYFLDNSLSSGLAGNWPGKGKAGIVPDEGGEDEADYADEAIEVQKSPTDETIEMRESPAGGTIEVQKSQADETIEMRESPSSADVATLDETRRDTATPGESRNPTSAQAEPTEQAGQPLPPQAYEVAKRPGRQAEPEGEPGKSESAEPFEKAAQPDRQAGFAAYPQAATGDALRIEADAPTCKLTLWQRIKRFFGRN